MHRVRSLVLGLVLLWSTQAVAQDRQPGAVNVDAPTCEDRLMASKRGLVNVALQVTELEAQVEHLKKRLEVATKELVSRDAALAKVKTDEKQSKTGEEK